MAQKTLNRRASVWLWAILALALSAVGGCVLYNRTPPTPMAEAYVAVESPHVLVIDRPWLTMLPPLTPPKTGIIFYPGPRIDPLSYAPFAEQVASQGYLVVVVPMPVNQAMLGVDVANDVMEVNPNIDTWVVAGHSQGGMAAARYALSNPERIRGLMLWASYPHKNDDLSASDIKVMSLYATLDGITTQSDIDSSRNRLPPDTTWVKIEGGNHAGFAWYGDQRGDLTATIGRPKQTRIVTQETLAFLADLDATLTAGQ